MKEYSFHEALSKTLAHVNSQENLDKCVPFEELNQKYTLLARKYANSYCDLYIGIASRIHRREYSRGGKNLHLGYYSPSLTDLVTGNCSRGKLYKRIPTKNTYNFEYLFDEDRRLICVNEYSKGCGNDDFRIVSTEFLIYEGNTVTTFLYAISPCTNETPNSLILITKSEYSDGQITRHEEVLCSLACTDNSCSEINTEDYEYSEKRLKKLLCSSYTPPKSIIITEYSFDTDADGQPSAYKSEQLWPPIYYPRHDTVYKVNRK